MKLEHYLTTLARKPGAVNGSLALRQMPHKIQALFDSHFTDDARDFVLLLQYAAYHGFTHEDIIQAYDSLTTCGQSSTGWFFGFKLHLICNEKGELLNFVFTPANTDDRQPLDYTSFMKNVKGKLVGDKGYLSQKLFERLFVNGIQLITKIKKNMKNSLMSVHDKLLLRKRAIIESINDELKNICQIEHSRHRSFGGFLTNALAALAAYCFLPKKLSINIAFDTSNQLTLF